MSFMPNRALLLSIAATATLFFAVSAAPAAACSGASERVNKRKAARAVLCLINRERLMRGRQAVRPNGRLSRVAFFHAKDIVKFRFQGHTSPTRGTLKARVKRSGFGRSRGSFTFGEIMGAGERYRGSPKSIVRAWMHHHIHRVAILHPRFSAAGVGVTSGTPMRGRSRGGLAYVVTFGG